MHSEDCLVCYNIVDDTEQAIACVKCDNWYHVKCAFNIKVSKLVYKNILSVENIAWTCNKCVKNVDLERKPVQGRVGGSGSVNQFQTAFRAINANVQAKTVTNANVHVKLAEAHSSSPSSKKGAPSFYPTNSPKTLPQPGWELVKVKKRSFKNKSTPQARSIQLTNRFKLLDIAPTNDKSEGNEYKLIGDSIIRGQGSDSNGKKKKKGSTFCRPGAKLEDITDMIKKLNDNETYNNQEFIIHVGTNDMVHSPKPKGYKNRVIPYRASELIYEKYLNLIKALKSRNTQSYLVGMLPRYKVTNELNSRILSMNSRVQRLCKEAGVGYIDMFTLFQDNPNLFTSDGLHLSNQGRQLYAETLKVNINKFGN